MLKKPSLLPLIAAACFAHDTARLDEVVRASVANHEFMGSVLVARGSEVLFSKGYGSANLEWDIPNAPDTRFRLGSITKQFTAASILLLEERGKLNLEDPVKRHLTDAPAAWDKITIYHLLTHTSGIPSFTGFPDYPSIKLVDTTAGQLVARFRDKPLEFQPGEKWVYSNSGYVLLGHLIEQITGASYETFLRDNIFAPLGMKDSGYDSNSAIIPHRASGYTPGGNGMTNAGYVHMSVPHAAGALYSTTGDLLRWEQGLFGGKLLTAASLEKMTKPLKSNYALGLMVETEGARTVIRHGGGIEGFNTMLAYYPADKLTVVVLANLNGQAPGSIAGKLAAVARGEAVQLAAERKQVTIDPKVLAGYVGTYQLAPGMNFLITLEGGQLMEKLGGQAKYPIFPESTTKFFLKVVDAQIEFFRDPGGTVTHLVLHQGGRDQKAPRTSDKAEAPPERTAITVPPETLRQYVGTYELAPNFAIVMTLENGQLMTQATGQSKFPMFVESATRFFLKVVDAQVDFVRNEQGAVTHLVLHQGGRDVKGTRRLQ